MPPTTVIEKLLWPKTTPASPILRLVRAQEAKNDNLGCCMLIRCIAMAAAGMIPDDPRTWQDWYKLDREGWKRGNVWEDQLAAEGPWVSLISTQELLGGEIVTQQTADAPPPALTPDRSHVIQHYRTSILSWKPGDKTGSGHTYYVRRAPEGQTPYNGGKDSLRLTQTGVKLGYRDEGLALSGWPLRKGLIVSVLTLPEGL